MAIHDLKPKDVIISFNIKVKLTKGKDDKHEDEQEKPISKVEQDQSGKET